MRTCCLTLAQVHNVYATRPERCVGGLPRAFLVFFLLRQKTLRKTLGGHSMSWLRPVRSHKIMPFIFTVLNFLPLHRLIPATTSQTLQSTNNWSSHTRAHTRTQLCDIGVALMAAICIVLYKHTHT